MDDKTVIILNCDGDIDYQKLVSKLPSAILINEYAPTTDCIKVGALYDIFSDSGITVSEQVDFINEFKAILDKYFRVTHTYLNKEYDEFENGSFRILFVLMDNFDDIDTFRSYVEDEHGRVATMYLSTDGTTDNYHYDYIFDVDENDPVKTEHEFIIAVKQITEEVTWKLYRRTSL